MELVKLWPFYLPQGTSHGPSIWFFLNPNQFAQGCCMPNFTLLGKSVAPFPRNGQTLPFYGQNMILQIGSS